MKIFIVTAMGFIQNGKGEVLLTQRHDLKNPSFHRKWQLPAGGIEEKETPVETVVREVKEETGLKVKVISQQPAITFGKIDKEGASLRIGIILLAFRCRAIGGEIGLYQDKETIDCRFFEYKKIPWNNLLPGNKKLINELYQKN